jgi:hypothetical protein
LGIFWRTFLVCCTKKYLATMPGKHVMILGIFSPEKNGDIISVFDSTCGIMCVCFMNFHFVRNLQPKLIHKIRPTAALGVWRRSMLH